MPPATRISIACVRPRRPWLAKATCSRTTCRSRWPRARGSGTTSLADDRRRHAMCTANPAKAIGAADRLGSLAVGRQADISVLDIREGDWMVYDVLGTGLRVDRALVPFVTVKKGRVFTPDWGPRSWGWEPDRALPAGGPIRGGCC